MRSDEIKEGLERAGHRALLHALGVTRDELHKPFIAVVRDGDRIQIDIPNRKLELLVSDDELMRRLQKWHLPAKKYRGYLARYVKEVGPTYEGATLE